MSKDAYRSNGCLPVPKKGNKLHECCVFRPAFGCCAQPKASRNLFFAVTMKFQSKKVKINKKKKTEISQNMLKNVKKG